MTDGMSPIDVIRQMALVRCDRCRAGEQLVHFRPGHYFGHPRKLTDRPRIRHPKMLLHQCRAYKLWEQVEEQIPIACAPIAGNELLTDYLVRLPKMNLWGLEDVKARYRRRAETQIEWYNMVMAHGQPETVREVKVTTGSHKPR